MSASPTESVRVIPTREEYARVFHEEQCREYPVMDALEATAGYAIDRATMEGAARVLACPVKGHPPNWQHGRMIYALVREYLSTRTGPFSLVDIGTAKGFSALCLLWALGEHEGHVVSVDVLDPKSHARRNSVAECDGLKTLAEMQAPWPEASLIEFRHQTGIDCLSASMDRIHVAFVDGKHDATVVAQEAKLLSYRQEPGDLAIFDDVHLPAIWAAVAAAKGYDVTRIDLLPHRAYAVAVRR